MAQMTKLAGMRLCMCMGMLQNTHVCSYACTPDTNMGILQLMSMCKQGYARKWTSVVKYPCLYVVCIAKKPMWVHAVSSMLMYMDEVSCFGRLIHAVQIVIIRKFMVGLPDMISHKADISHW